MMTNIFKHFPEAALQAEAETFETLLSQPNVKIERIISTGQSSPPDFWYCPPHIDFVICFAFSSGLIFSNDSAVRVLKRGDVWTSAAQ